MLPMDDNIAVSYLNTMLRDKYEDLDDLCASLDEDREALLARMLKASWHYDEKTRQFVRNTAGPGGDKSA